MNEKNTDLEIMRRMVEQKKQKSVFQINIKKGKDER